jgi:mannose-6-phosphate isomerase-like protein (cupin superfamily)/heme-degrading monooxygenase HmoA
MKKLVYLIAFFLTFQLSAQSLKDRIIPNDGTKYRELTGVHEGAGKMGFTQLIGRTELSTNFLYLHAGQIQAKSGIGHHFHHSIEEMFVILDGEAEFTVNGKTSKIKAPAIVPCKMGDSHAIYNSTDKSLTWLNFAVSRTKGKTDAFDLGDTRVGATLDPVPTFVNGRLEKEKMKPNNPAYAGEDILYRRVLGPEVFSTDWNHVDHVVIPAGGKNVSRKLEGFEEVYYVTKGSGTIALGNENGNIKAHDAFYGLLGENLTLSNTGTEDLELLVIGIAPSKQKGLAIQKPLVEPKSVALQMEFVVPSENAKAFEQMYYSIYVPAMTVQQGYLSSKLLRIFPETISKEIQAEQTSHNYQIMIEFDTEASRRKWVASAQHQIAWPAASGLATSFKWKGYEVMGDDDQK